MYSNWSCIDIILSYMTYNMALLMYPNWSCIDSILSYMTNNKALIMYPNRVVSNHFYSVKILLFSSARSRDFDGLIGIELPVSMYTTKTPIDLCRFSVRSSTYKNLNIFCKRQISIKLFYLFQRLQCRDNYFFKIKFVFFLYLRLSASSKENDLPLCIYFWYQTDSGVANTSIYSAVSLVSPYYNYL